MKAEKGKKLTPKRAAIFLSGLCSFAYFTSYISRYTFTVCISELTSDSVGLLTEERAGLIGMLLFVFYGCGQLVSGILGDRVKPEILVGIGICGSAVCNLLLPFAIGSVPALAVLWSVNGFVQSMFWPPLVKTVSVMLPRKNYNAATLAVSIAAHVGNVVLYVASSFFIGTVGRWQLVFAFAVAVCAVTLAVWIVGIRYFKRHAPSPEGDGHPDIATNEQKADAPKERGGLARAILSSGFLMLVGGIILQGALKEGVTAWLPSYVRDVYSLSAGTAILGNIAIPITSIVCILGIDVLYSKLLKNEALGSAVMFGIGATFAAITAFVPDLPQIVTVICAAMITASMHGVNLCLIAYMPGRFARYGKVSTVSGITNACAYVGCSVYMYGISLIESQSTRALTWFIIPAVGFVFCIAALPAWLRFCKRS